MKVALRKNILKAPFSDNNCWINPRQKKLYQEVNDYNRYRTFHRQHSNERYFCASKPISSPSMELVTQLIQVGLNDLKNRFNELAKKWKKETAIYSLAAKKINNRNYMNIIEIGDVHKKKILRLILEDLSKSPEYWHFALKSITKENPVPKQDVTDLKKVREYWLEWGKQNKLI